MTEHKQGNDAVVKEIIRRWMEGEEFDTVHEYTAYYLRGIADVFDCLEDQGGDVVLSRAVAFVREQLAWQTIAYYEDLETDHKLYDEDPEFVAAKDRCKADVSTLNMWEFHDMHLERRIPR